MFISDDSNGKSVCDFLFVTNCNQVSFLEGHKTDFGYNDLLSGIFQLQKLIHTYKQASK